MKKWIWLILAVVVACVAISSSGFIKLSEQPSVVESIKVENFNSIQEEVEAPRNKKTEDSVSVSPPPQVSAERLLSHIQNLNFKRYTDAERSRTRNYITKELKKLGWQPQLQKFAEGINVFAEKKGTDKQAGAILVGAHYDTVAISPGADDNASGVAVLLEIARLFASRSTPRTLQLAFFDKEEAGLLGSQAFVTKSTQSLKNLEGVIVMDMVGYACYKAGCQQYPATLPITPPTDKGDFLAVVGDTEHLPLLNTFQQFNQEVAIAKTNQNPITTSISLPPIFTLPVPFKGLLTPDTLRSDHAPFWLQGVGAVLVTDTANLRTPHYHQSSDTPSTIERSFFTGAAQIIVKATSNLLQSNHKLDSST